MPPRMIKRRPLNTLYSPLINESWRGHRPPHSERVMASKSVLLPGYRYSWISSSLTAEGVSTPRSVNSRVSRSGGV